MSGPKLIFDREAPDPLRRKPRSKLKIGGIAAIVLATVVGAFKADEIYAARQLSSEVWKTEKCEYSSGDSIYYNTLFRGIVAEEFDCPTDLEPELARLRNRRDLAYREVFRIY